MLTLVGIVEIKQIIVVITLIVMLGLFAFEIYPPAVVAIGGAALFLVTGIVSSDDLLSVASNPALPTIAGMFVVSTALVRTGLVTHILQKLKQTATHSPKLTIYLLLGLTMVLSAFINNTPVILLMIPVMISVANAVNQPASKYLIPLSHASIIGGTLTLIGSSTNILANGLMIDSGLAGLGMFEFSALGICIAATGGLYFWFFGRTLPIRIPITELQRRQNEQQFLTDALITKDSNLIGKKLSEISFFSSRGIAVVDVVRKGRSLQSDLNKLLIQNKDHLILESSVAEVLSLKEDSNIAIGGVTTIAEKQATIVEALISPRSPLLRRPLHEARLQRRYGVHVLAIHRHEETLDRRVQDIRVHGGDTLIIEGDVEDIQRLSEEMDLVNLNVTAERPYRRDKAPIAASVIIAIVALASMNVLPIITLLVIGCAIILLTRCLDADEAFTAIDWQILILMGAMLVVGQGVQITGVLDSLLVKLIPLLRDLSPWLILLSLFLVTSFLTEVISNTAIIILMLPLAIAIAQQLGFDPRPLAIVTMIAASASFSTPVGYQTNTLVYSAGGYRFLDFVKYGLAMNIFVAFITSWLVPIIWPL